MNTLSQILLCSNILILLILAYSIYRYRIQKKKKDILKTLFDHLTDYVFLIDPDAKVWYSNYYRLNPEIPPIGPVMLGNMLHCKNGCDAGMCGSHSNCKNCVIRQHIVEAFEQKGSFEEVEANLDIYSKEGIPIETSVIVSGKYLMWEEKPYLVITLREASAQTLMKQQIQKLEEEKEVLQLSFYNFCRNTESELYTPVNALISFSQKLTVTPSDTERQHCQQMIQEYQQILVHAFKKMEKWKKTFHPNP